MKQHEMTNGTRKVVTTEESFMTSPDGFKFRSRLYVNKGETATLTCAKHRTMAGARKWAAKVLAA